MSKLPAHPGLQARHALLALACAALLAGCAHGPAPSAYLRGSRFLAALNLPAVGAVPYAPAQLRGRVTLVNFFATWCFPCLGELPLLDRLQHRFAERGFTVVAVGMDQEGFKVLEPFAQTFRYAFPMVVADAPLREGATAYGRIAALPTSFLLGRDGEVVAAYQGLATSSDLESYIERALAQGP